jgi:hypothetical protein
VRASYRKDRVWIIFDKRYWPDETVTAHLNFALRRETPDLLILNRPFEAMPAPDLEVMIRQTPTGIQARRAWPPR